MKIDYLIVGGGIAGHCLAHLLLQEDKTFTIYDLPKENISSRIAAGLYNPISLKRTSLVWKGHESMNFAIPFYQTIEKKGKAQFLNNLPIHRIYANYEEVNNWEVKSGQENYQRFLEPNPKTKTPEEIYHQFGYGIIKESGYMDMTTFFETSDQILNQKEVLKNERFIYETLQKTDAGWTYGAQSYQQVIFCEGVGVQKNPFFNNLPITPNKGDVLTLESDVSGNDWKGIYSKSKFLIPLGNHQFRAGSTYQPDIDQLEPDPEKETEIIEQVRRFFKADFKTVKHDWGLRPIAHDRHPVLGTHHEKPDLFIFNGLSSKGVMMAPLLAKMLIEFTDQKTELPKEIDVYRFYRKMMA